LHATRSGRRRALRGHFSSILTATSLLSAGFSCPPQERPRTDFRDFKGAAKPLDDIDLPKLGARIGIGEDEMHAVIDVDTSGGAWDRQGRPKMLFEPHVFYRDLSGAARERLSVGLAYRRGVRNPIRLTATPDCWRPWL
jgi:hypothetical protein